MHPLIYYEHGRWQPSLRQAKQREQNNPLDVYKRQVILCIGNRQIFISTTNKASTTIINALILLHTNVTVQDVYKRQVVSHAWSEARRPEDVHGTPSRAHKAPYPQPARKAFAPRADRPRGHRQMRCPSVLAAHAAAYRHAADARRRLVACRRSSRRRAVRVPTGKRAPQAFVSQTKPASPFRKQIPAGARLQADPCERLTAAPPPRAPGRRLSGRPNERFTFPSLTGGKACLLYTSRCV